MKLWIDAQLSPKLADWLNRNYAVKAMHVAALGLQRASDQEIFDAARDARSIVITKDRDFAELLEQLGPPPQVIWVTCGNTSNRAACRKFLPTRSRTPCGSCFEAIHLWRSPVVKPERSVGPLCVRPGDSIAGEPNPSDRHR